MAYCLFASKTMASPSSVVVGSCEWLRVLVRALQRIGEYDPNRSSPPTRWANRNAPSKIQLSCVVHSLFIATFPAVALCPAGPSLLGKLSRKGFPPSRQWVGTAGCWASPSSRYSPTRYRLLLFIYFVRLPALHTDQQGLISGSVRPMTTPPLRSQRYIYAVI